MSRDGVTLGAVQWSGQQCTLRMRTHLVGTEYIGEYRCLWADSTENTEAGTLAVEPFLSHFYSFCKYVHVLFYIKNKIIKLKKIFVLLIKPKGVVTRGNGLNLTRFTVICILCPLL